MGKTDKRPISLLIHFPRFGPYHLARLNAAFSELGTAGVKVMAMETASLDDTYAWQQENSATVFERYVALPGEVYEKSSAVAIWRGINSVLDRAKPHAIAICGYSSPDSWSALVWCKLHHGKAILLSDSKYDDVPRLVWKERLKQMLVCRFDAALCAGRSHRMYLEGLGMKAERIFEGVDVVDNDFFWQGAEQARRDPASYRATLGIEFPEPFFLASARFIERKNIDGLLRAYAQYRHHVQNAGKPCAPWRLVVLGEGTERATLEGIVDSQDIQGVSFPGFLQINKLPTYYGLASVFIHPAHRDQWGLVVNEAMAAGLPVLVSNGCGCASDLVHEGENGFTFDSNDVATLADLMIKVSSGKVDLGAMGLSSHNRISEWGLGRFVHGLYGALQVALGSNGS